MGEKTDYGPRLSGREYDEAVTSLAKEYDKALPSKDDSRLRRQELELKIDATLGINFPSDRREQLWQVAQEIEAERWKLVLIAAKTHLKTLFSGGNHSEASDFGALESFVTSKYRKALTEDETRQFLTGNERPEVDRTNAPGV